MPIQKSQSRIDTGETGWISIHINDSESPVSGYGESPQMNAPLPEPAARHLFEYARQARVSFPERFPRLTLFAIAVVLLASALAAEFDYLHGAGYYWP
ncbi:MAG: hypothetical protein WA354_08410 [Terracidiphilus sp.]